MPIYRGQAKRISSPQQVSHKPNFVPASTGGMNAIQALSMMPAEDCIYCHNLMPSEYGMRTRRGYREWANIPTGKPVRSLIPYEGQAKDASKDALFAATEDGIYDVTNFGETAPILVQAFGTQGDEAGWGVWTEFTNDANERFLQYADEANGLFEYSETTGLWTVPVITGPDVTLIAYVTTWKNRLWYIERSSGEAWYLPPDSKSGTATAFTFGSKFQHGGDMLAIFNWTIDGGNGIDDFFVGISRGGDVLVYQGVDPSATTPPAAFTLVGSWFVGEFPESRRIGVQHGGELYLLSTYGVSSLRDLLEGVAVDKPAGPALKINRMLRDAVEEGKDEREWAMNIYPSDGFLQIVTPYRHEDQAAALQYNQNLTTQSWGRWRKVPVNCGSTWSGRYMMGGKDGKIWEYSGVLDGPTLDLTEEGVGVDYDVLTSFQAPGGNPTTYKRCGLIRPIVVQGEPGSLNVAALYDYEIFGSLRAPTLPSPTSGDTWDNSDWDVATWDYSLGALSRPIGALGIGRTIAVAMRGTALSRLTFVGWDMSWTEGGFL